MIILRTPKGWTCPKEIDGHKLEGSWRAHQMPILDPVTNPAHLAAARSMAAQLQARRTLRRAGTLIPELQGTRPRPATRRISANPHANGGMLRKPLDLPDFRDYAVTVEQPGQTELSSTDTSATSCATSCAAT